jgi:hypothetical protein
VVGIPKLTKRLELHLLEYHKRVLEYLECFGSLPTGRLSPLRLKTFLEPTDKLGYNDNPISDDLITDVFLEFSDQTRKEESNEYLCTLTGMDTNSSLIRQSFLYFDTGRCISGDATFKIGAKSTLADSKGKRLMVMKGGMSTYINEINEILSWVRHHVKLTNGRT